jgi:hypothetical protein
MAAGRASYLLHVRGRRNGAARARSEPPVVVLGLLLRELRMLLANHGWFNIEKTTIFIWQVIDLPILICTKHSNTCSNYI